MTYPFCGFEAAVTGRTLDGRLTEPLREGATDIDELIYFVW
jgi:hypothetical protein